jgi:hypothetical protein
MGEGLSYETFGATIGFSRSVLYDWEKKYPVWVEAKEVAFEHCLLFWEKAGRSGMFMANFKPGVWVHNMKARFRKDGWCPGVQDSGGAGDEYDFEYAD